MDQQLPTNPEVVNAVIRSKESIVQTFQDILKGAQLELTQAQHSGNNDSLINAQQQVDKAMTQLKQAQISCEMAKQLAQQ
jgi:hypothetical protein